MKSTITRNLERDGTVLKIPCPKCKGQNLFKIFGVKNNQFIGCEYCNFTGKIPVRHFHKDPTSSCDGKILIPHKTGKHYITCSKCGLQFARKEKATFERETFSNVEGFKLNITDIKNKKIIKINQKRLPKHYNWKLYFLILRKNKYPLERLIREGMVKKRIEIILYPDDYIFDAYGVFKFKIEYESNEVMEFTFDVDSHKKKVKFDECFYSEKLDKDDPICQRCKNGNYGLCLKKFIKRNKDKATCQAYNINPEKYDRDYETDNKGIGLGSAERLFINAYRNHYTSKLYCPKCGVKGKRNRMFIDDYKDVEVPLSLRPRNYTKFLTGFKKNLKNASAYVLNKLDEPKRKDIYIIRYHCNCGYNVNLFFDKSDFPYPVEVLDFVYGKFQKYCDRDFKPVEKCYKCLLISPIMCDGAFEYYLNLNERERKKFLAKINPSSTFEEELGNFDLEVMKELTFKHRQEKIETFKESYIKMVEEAYKVTNKKKDFDEFYRSIDWKAIRGGKFETFNEGEDNEYSTYVDEDDMGFKSREAYSWTKQQLQILYEIRE